MIKELLRIDNGKIDTGVYGSLNGLYFSLPKGQTHAVVFADLHEKRTFIQAMQGALPFSQGRLYLDEVLLTPPRTIREVVYVIHRTSALMVQLKIWENVYYSSLSTFVFHKQIYQKMLQDVMDRFDVRVDPDKPVNQLSHAEAIQIELLKAYVMKRHVIVLADLSYYLTTYEMEEMFTLMEKIKACGFSFILIDSTRELSMKYAELFWFVRQGRTCGFYKPSELSDGVLQHILWQDADLTDDLSKTRRFFGDDADETVSLSFSGVSLGVLKDLHFRLGKGKMLKIVYLKEKDGDALLTLLRGEQPPEKGRVLLNNRAYRCRGISGAQAQGLCFLGDNPTENLMIPHMTVLDNIGLILWRKSKLVWFRGAYQRSIRQTLAETCGEDMWDTFVQDLTPVQAQKLVYAECLLFHPSVVVCVNPFTGMDCQVDDVTAQMMRRLLNKGISMLVVASYLPSMAMPGETLYLINGALSASEK